MTIPLFSFRSFCRPVARFLRHRSSLGPTTLLALALAGSAAYAAPPQAAPPASVPQTANTALAPGLVSDDEAATLAAWRARIHAAPTPSATMALWPQFSQMAQDQGRWDLLRAAARDILAAHGAPPALTASARQTLAFAADRTGDAPDADHVWQALGYVRQWQIIGPFDNASQSGFDHAYPPEQGLALGASCPGRDDQQLRWHPLMLIGRDGQCAVGQSLTDSAADVFYAATSLVSPRAGAARLQFDPTGASKVFVNGVLVFSDSLVRSHQDLVADPFSIPVSLRRGANTVLVKMADDDQSTAAFALRVTSADGSVLPGVTADAAHAALTASVPPPAALPARVETVWTTAARTLPAGPASAALVGDLLRRSSDYAASADALRAALKDAPQDGWLHWQLAQTLLADDQNDEANAERDLALAALPGLIDAQLAALSDGDLPASEKISRLKDIRARSPRSPDAAWALARAYQKAHVSSLALGTGRQALALSGGDDTVVEMSSMYKDFDRSADAARLLTVALRTAPGSADLLQEAADTLSGAADPAPAIALLQRVLAADPTRTPSRVTLVQMYEDSHDNAAAQRSLQRLRLERPQSGGICGELAEILQEEGHRQAATDLYQEAIRLNPADLSLREKLAVLSGEKPALDLAPPVPAGPILAGALQAQATGGASVLMLLDEARTVVYPDFATLTRIHQIIKVFDQAGVERYQSYGLDVPEASATATVESARVLKADGKVQDVTDGDGNSDDTVAFPSLAPGDVIDVTYRVENCRHGALARQFWSEWRFDGPDEPSRLSRFVLIAPPGVAFQTAAHGAVPAATTKDVGAWRVQEWRMADIPAYAQEQGMPGSVDSSRWLDISTVKSWPQIVDWYRGLSAPRCVPDEAVRAKALALTADCHTDTEKIQALESFVAQDVQYQSSPFRNSAYVPTEGKQVLRERYGDCKDKAALLTAMLAAVGIHSDMVLLSPRSHGLTPYLPSPRFNHAIARVQTADGPLWIDATANQLRFGGLPDGDQQVPALVIAPETTALTNTPVLPLHGQQLDDASVCTLDPQGSLHVQTTWTMQDHLAWQMRSALQEVPANKQDLVLRYMADAFFKNSLFDSGKLEQVDAVDKPLVMRIAYHADHYSTLAGSFRLVPLPWSEEGRDKLLTRLQASPNRTQDLEVADERGLFHSTLDLTLPDGWTPQEMPADSKTDTPFGSCHVAYTLRGSVLHGERDLSMTALRVPAAQVAQYTAFLEGVEQEGQKQLVLRKL